MKAEGLSAGFDGIGLSVPGRVDTVARRVLFAPALGRPPFDMQRALEAVTGLRVRIENEANRRRYDHRWSAHPGTPRYGRRIGSRSS
jgi:predicted NBD/HSP70 family sugar kinase